MKEIDARGLACPAPVLLTRETIAKEQPNLLKVIVDNEAAQQNVSRFLESQKFETSVQQDGDEFHVIGKQGERPFSEEITATAPEGEANKIMVMIINHW